jgi:hypothetical protein
MKRKRDARNKNKIGYHETTSEEKGLKRVKDRIDNKNQ